MKKIFLFTMVSIALAGSLKAQYYYDRSKNPDKAPVQATKKALAQSSNYADYSKFFYASWDANMPMSNASFINQTSSLGFKLGFRKKINDEDRFWVGGDLGEAIYKQYTPYQVYNFGTQSVATDLYHYAYSYSGTVNIDYFFFPMDKRVAPYVGLGIGASYIKFSEYYNISSSSATTWGLLVRPEAGFLIGFTPTSPWRLKAAVHFDYASNSYNFYTSNSFLASSKYSNFISTGFQIGILKMIW